MFFLRGGGLRAAAGLAVGESNNGDSGAASGSGDGGAYEVRILISGMQAGIYNFIRFRDLKFFLLDGRKMATGESNKGDSGCLNGGV